MIKHKDSHVDHGLTIPQLQYLIDRFADRQTSFIETIVLPEDLGTVPWGLYGPIVGDPAIAEGTVTYGHRGARTWDSRLVDLPTRQCREVTVIAGPHEEACLDGKIQHACILYTAFGGPVTPQEPGDPSCKDAVVSTTFWREHALTK